MGLNAVTDSLTWEHVFNGDLDPLATLEVAQAAAKIAGYSFLAFEGALYAADRHTGAWRECAQSANTLAEGSAVAAALRQTISRRNEQLTVKDREIERLEGQLSKAAKRAADADEQCERQRKTIAALRDAATTRIRSARDVAPTPDGSRSFEDEVRAVRRRAGA